MFGTTYPLIGYDGELAQLQAQLVRIGFLGAVTGRWDWDTYQAIQYADRYLQIGGNIAVHGSSGTIDIDDAWVSALRSAHPAPAGTAGLWADLPHTPRWPTYVGFGLITAGLLGLGAWIYKRHWR